MTVEIHSEDQEIRVSSAAHDQVSIAESVKCVLKQDTTHFDNQTTHFERIIHQQQQHIPFQVIKAAAIKKMVNKYEGITYLDVLKIADNPTYAPKQAMELLRNHRKNGNLYTFNRTKPQQYYLSKADAEYVYARTTHFGPTGVNTFQGGVLTENLNAGPGVLPQGPHEIVTETATTTLAVVDYQQANSLYDRLILLETAPLSIHNLHLDFTMLDKGAESYNLLGLDSKGVIINPHNKAKTITRIILSPHRRVRYNLYPSGRTEVLISCSKSPFRIQTDQDVTVLMGFMHQVQYSLSLNLSDTTNSYYVPPVNTWRLTEADINKDIPCNTSSLHLEPKLELKMLDTTLRLYVKVLGGESVLRLEEMRTFNETFFEAIASLRCGVVEKGV